MVDQGIIEPVSKPEPCPAAHTCYMMGEGKGEKEDNKMEEDGDEGLLEPEEGTTLSDLPSPVYSDMEPEPADIHVPVSMEEEEREKRRAIRVREGDSEESSVGSMPSSPRSPAGTPERVVRRDPIDPVDPRLQPRNPHGYLRGRRLPRRYELERPSSPTLPYYDRPRMNPRGAEAEVVRITTSASASEEGPKGAEIPEKQVQRVKVLGPSGDYEVRMEPGNLTKTDLERVLPLVLFSEKYRISVKPLPVKGTWQRESRERGIQATYEYRTIFERKGGMVQVKQVKDSGTSSSEETYLEDTTWSPVTRERGEEHHEARAPDEIPDVEFIRMDTREDILKRVPTVDLTDSTSDGGRPARKSKATKGPRKRLRNYNVGARVGSYRYPSRGRKKGKRRRRKKGKKGKKYAIKVTKKEAEGPKSLPIRVTKQPPGIRVTKTQQSGMAKKTTEHLPTKPLPSETQRYQLAQVYLEILTQEGKRTVRAAIDTQSNVTYAKWNSSHPRKWKDGEVRTVGG